MNVHIRLWLVFWSLVVMMLPAAAQQLDRSDDVDEYIPIFESGSVEEQRVAVQDLQWKGLSDTRLFDVIETRLIAGHLDETAEPLKAKTAKWYTYALAYSGQSAYLPTLERISKESSWSAASRAAARAMKLLPDYQRWNAIINSDRLADSGEPIDVQLVFNMLDADELELKRMGAKRIFFSDVKFDPLLSDRAEAEALQLLAMNSDNSKLRSDTIAWLAKALGSTNNPKYTTTLETLASDGPSNVQRHASKALKLMKKRSHWNDIINAGVDPEAADAETRRMLNMLGSGEPEMTRYAAKRIWHGDFKHDVAVTDQAEAALRQLNGKDTDTDATYLDTLAWLCKALGSTHNPKYRESIAAVRSRHQAQKIQTHTSKALQMLDGGRSGGGARRLRDLTA